MRRLSNTIVKLHGSITLRGTNMSKTVQEQLVELAVDAAAGTTLIEYAQHDPNRLALLHKLNILCEKMQEKSVALGAGDLSPQIVLDHLMAKYGIE